MKKLIILTSFGFICGFQLFAQQGFTKAYNFNYPVAMVFNAMILDGEELIVCGYIKDTISPYQQGIVFTKLDTLGNVLSYSTYYDSLGYNYAAADYPGGLIKLQDNSGYLFTGSLVEGPRGFLVKYDLNGNIEWVKIFEDSVALQAYFLSLLETDTGFLICGHKQLPGSSSSNDFFLLKTDKEGNMLWEHQYGQVAHTDVLNSFIALNNNEYVLGGYKAGGGLPQSQVQIFAVDSTGAEKWYWEGDAPPEQGVENWGCIGLQKNQDGNWVYVRKRAEHQGGSSWYTQARFVVRDSNFNILTEQIYDDVDGQTNDFFNLISLTDGDWLGIGSNRELVNTPGIPSHNFGWLARISNGQDGITALGDSLWTRRELTFPDSLFPQGQYFHSAVELPSRSIIAAGYFNNMGIHPSHGILIKFNQHGCIDTIDCIPTNFPNIVISNQEVLSPDFKVYPNPAQYILHVESEQMPAWDKIEVLDMSGSIVKSTLNNSSISIADLLSGIYIVRLWKDGRFWMRKVVKY